MTKDPATPGSRRRRSRRADAGFTLVEMLVVITIMALDHVSKKAIGVSVTADCPATMSVRCTKWAFVRRPCAA